MYATKLSLITFSLLIFSFLLCIVQGVPVVEKSSQRNNIIYTRYVRRRPSEYPSDLYVDDFVEVFRVRQTKPTPSYQLSDDEVDRIIRCDFDPQLKECDDLLTRTTLKPKVTTAEITSTTSVPLASWITTTTTQTTPTTTTTELPVFITTEDLPFLPDIPASLEETTASVVDPDAEIVDHTPEVNELADKNDYEDANNGDYDENNEDNYADY